MYILLLLEIRMKKYLKILLFSLMAFMGCEELKGPVGPAGADGTANIYVEVVQMTSDNTQLIDLDGYGSGNAGYLSYEHETSHLTDAVLDSGLVKVELSPDDGDTWYSLPYILYSGDDDGVEYMYTCEYAYAEGVIGISWWCSFDRSAQDWVNIENLWAVDYKITIVTP